MYSQLSRTYLCQTIFGGAPMLNLKQRPLLNTCPRMCGFGEGDICVSLNTEHENTPRLRSIYGCKRVLESIIFKPSNIKLCLEEEARGEEGRTS